MKKPIPQIALLAVLFLALACWLIPSAHVESSALKTKLQESTTDASKLFEKHCAKCHGKDGRAKTFKGKMVGARNLTDDKWQAKVTDEQIKQAIKKGPEAMPAFEKTLSEEEIDRLVAYVRHFKNTAPK